MKTYRITQRSTAAFSLVEVTLALGVAGFCLIAILGMLPAGLNTNQNSTRQTAANGILSAILTDIRATPRAATQSPLFGILMSPTSSAQTLCCTANGACSILSGSQCPNATLFLVTITGGSGSTTSSGEWGRGGGDDGEEDNGSGTKSQGTERFDVKITWPYSAASPAPAAAGNVEAFIGIDRNAKSHGGGEGEDGD